MTTTESETVTYLGYRIILRPGGHLTVYTRGGILLLAGRYSMATARKLIRGHRAAYTGVEA